MMMMMMMMILRQLGASRSDGRTEGRTQRERERERRSNNLTSPPRRECQLAAEAVGAATASDEHNPENNGPHACVRAQTHARADFNIPVEYTVVEYAQEDIHLNHY